jgi:hypothetical protein
VRIEKKIQESRRKMNKQPELLDKSRNLPVWNEDKKKYVKQGKIFQCMSLKKEEITKLAKQLNVSSEGFKKDVCVRIENKIKN